MLLATCLIFRYQYNRSTPNIQDTVRTTLKSERCLILLQLQVCYALKLSEVSTFKTAENYSLAIARQFPASWHCNGGAGVEGNILFHHTQLQHMEKRQILSSHSVSMKKSSTYGSESHVGPRDHLLLYSAVIPVTRTHHPQTS